MKLIIVLLMLSTVAFAGVQKAATLTSGQNFSTDWANVGDPIVIGGFDQLSCVLDYDLNDSSNAEMRLVGLLEPTSTVVYPISVLKEGTTNTTYYPQIFVLNTGTTQSIIEVPIGSKSAMLPVVQFQIRANPTGTIPARMNLLKVFTSNQGQK